MSANEENAKKGKVKMKKLRHFKDSNKDDKEKKEKKIVNNTLLMDLVYIYWIGQIWPIY